MPKILLQCEEVGALKESTSGSIFRRHHAEFLSEATNPK